MVITKNYEKEMEKIGNERNELSKELTKKLEELNEVAIELTRNGIEPETAYALAIKYAKFGYNTLMLKKNAFTIATSIMDSVKLAQKASWLVSGNTISFVLVNGVPIEYGFSTTLALAKTLGKFGIEVGRTAQIVVNGLVAGVQVIFIVTDVVLLVRSWSSDHPTLESLKKIVAKLEKEMEPVQELLEFFNE